MRDVPMKPSRLCALLATSCLLIGLNGGCLSLSMLNREAPNTGQRLDRLEHRVSMLEGDTMLPSGVAVVDPQAPPPNPTVHPLP